MSDPVTVRSRQEVRQRTPIPHPQSSERTGSPGQGTRLFLLMADLGVGEAFFLLALTLAEWVGGVARIEPVPSGSLRIVLAVLFPLMVGLFGLYNEARLASWRSQAGMGLRVLLWSAALTAGALFVLPQETPWALRIVFLLYHALLGMWLLLFRPLAAGLLYQHSAGGRPAERVLVVGSDSVARDVARNLGRSSRRVDLLGFADESRPASPLLQPFVLTELRDVPSLARSYQADLVVIARPDLAREDVILLSDQLVAGGVRVKVVSNVFNKLVDSVPFDTLNGAPLVPVGLTPLLGANERGKQLFDLLAAGLGTLLILPFLLGIALLVRLSSPGPILYSQIRMGKGGRPFSFYKFRSMRQAPDDHVHREYARELVQGGDAAQTDGNGKKIYKLVDDSRITAIGRLLRRTSLDELPQLINVLRGEMSLVGPRPCLPFEYELYREWQKRRLDVTPGMTGLWQVTGRSYVTFEDMVLLDLFYIANWSFWMDLKILFRTVPVVIWGKGGI